MGQHNIGRDLLLDLLRNAERTLFCPECHVLVDLEQGLSAGDDCPSCEEDDLVELAVLKADDVDRLIQ